MMEEIREIKKAIRKNIAEMLAKLSDRELAEKASGIEKRLFEFANFLESNIVLLYINNGSGVITKETIKKCFDQNKIVVLPAHDPEKHEMKLMKIKNLDTDLTICPGGLLKPDAGRCKNVPFERIDIAIIPGVALDEKGGRIGTGDGYYDKLIPKLSITTRKVALAFEDQIISQVPMESHDKHVDIIITEKRIIYKI
jgi:5-formyltetrahydrofolate cyclo-ligase